MAHPNVTDPVPYFSAPYIVRGTCSEGDYDTGKIACDPRYGRPGNVQHAQADARKRVQAHIDAKHKGTA